MSEVLRGFPNPACVSLFLGDRVRGILDDCSSFRDGVSMCDDRNILVNLVGWAGVGLGARSAQVRKREEAMYWQRRRLLFGVGGIEDGRVDCAKSSWLVFGAFGG